MATHGRLNIASFCDPMFQENGYLLWCPGSIDCWIVDPGFPPQPDEFAKSIQHHGLEPRAILLTHCHADHIAGVGPLRERFADVPIIAPADEANLLTDPRANMSAHLDIPFSAPPADRLIRPGQTLTLGELPWQLLDVAGHSPGGLAFYCEPVGVVLTGDALFAGSVGRYDFPGSSGERLLRNIRDNLLTLPGQTVLYSGHGPASTIGHEREHNVFLRMELGA